MRAGGGRGGCFADIVSEVRCRKEKGGRLGCEGISSPPLQLGPPLLESKTARRSVSDVMQCLYCRWMKSRGLCCKSAVLLSCQATPFASTSTSACSFRTTILLKPRQKSQHVFITTTRTSPRFSAAIKVRFSFKDSLRARCSSSRRTGLS